MVNIMDILIETAFYGLLGGAMVSWGLKLWKKGPIWAKAVSVPLFWFGGLALILAFMTLIGQGV